MNRSVCRWDNNMWQISGMDPWLVKSLLLLQNRFCRFNFSLGVLPHIHTQTMNVARQILSELPSKPSIFSTKGKNLYELLSVLPGNGVGTRVVMVDTQRNKNVDLWRTLFCRLPARSSTLLPWRTAFTKLPKYDSSRYVFFALYMSRKKQYSGTD